MRETYKARIVIRGTWILHVAQSNTLDVGQEAAFADQPVCSFGGLVLDELLDHDAKDVRDVLVERARLTLVLQGARVLGDGVLRKPRDFSICADSKGFFKKR